MPLPTLGRIEYDYRGLCRRASQGDGEAFAEAFETSDSQRGMVHEIGHFFPFAERD